VRPNIPLGIHHGYLTNSSAKVFGQQRLERFIRRNALFHQG
jgi:hypothetical protein